MTAAKKPTVLVVDDDDIMRELLKDMVEDSDEYQVIGGAADGRDAVKKCVALNPALVLLDINMPKMDGLQALEEIRKANPATMVLMVSAESTIDKVTEAIKKGAVGFVVKPLSPAKVLAKIKLCFNGQKKG